ncbi:MAG: DUF899 family protein [Planctomycetota bacterium]
MTPESTRSLKERIGRAEQGLLEAKKELTGLRRRLPPEEFSDYDFKTWDGGQVRLSELFGGKQDLIVVHNMGRTCPYCTMWADGFNGVLDHIQNRVAFVVVSPDGPQTQREFAQGRGWRFRMVSGEGSTFTRDAGYETPEGAPWPGVSAFRRTGDGKIHRTAHTSFGPGDDFCSVWHLFDLLEGGPRGWAPKFGY